MAKHKKTNVKKNRKSTVAFSPQKGNITVGIRCLDGNQITFRNLSPEEAARLIAEVKAFYLIRYGIDFAVVGGAA